MELEKEIAAVAAKKDENKAEVADEAVTKSRFCFENNSMLILHFAFFLRQQLLTQIPRKMKTKRKL